MAKKKKEKVVKKTTETNEPKGEVTKVKEKMKKPAEVIEETITKVDLSKLPETKEDVQPVDSTETEEVQEKVIEETTDKEEIVEQTTEENTETPIIEEVTSEEKVEKIAEKVTDVIEVAEQTGIELPENIQKVVDFMNDTGGDLNDYVKLNQDYSKLDNQDLLLEHYKQTKPHLNHEEINFLMEDQFSYDEDTDDERDIRRKKLALKEQVASAKAQLEENKSKYYDEIKSGSKLTKEQQEAINFYNEQVGVAEANEEISNDFINKTNRFFWRQIQRF